MAEGLHRGGLLFEAAGLQVAKTPPYAVTIPIGVGFELIGFGLDLLAADLISGGRVLGLTPYDNEPYIESPG